MAKQTGEVFETGVRTSESNGAVKVHECAEEVRALLGAADEIWFEGNIDLLTGTNPRVTFKAYHTCRPGVTPLVAGNALTLTGTVQYTAAGPVKFLLSGPFMLDVEVVGEVESTNAAGQVNSVFSLRACTIVR